MADVEEDGLADTLKGLDTSRVVTRIVDVSSQDEVEAMVSAAVERFGRLDVIVNNAGVGADGTVTEVSMEGRGLRQRRGSLGGRRLERLNRPA